MKIFDGTNYFENVPPRFESYFPSNDSLASDRFQSLITANKGKAPNRPGPFIRWSARSFVDALQITEKARAINGGDMLGRQLSKIYELKSGVGGDWVYGLFSKVNFGDAQDFAGLAEKLIDYGFAKAMSALSISSPQAAILAGVVRAGLRLNDLFQSWWASQHPPNILPWSEYSKDVNDDLVQLWLDEHAGGVDWTQLWMPPFELAPWVFGWSEKREGMVFGPKSSGKGLAWDLNNYGCIPGTARVFGNSQARTPGPAAPDPKLRRMFRAPKGVTPKVGYLPWSLDVQFCGDDLPALGQLGVALWQQVMAPGPEMYRVHAQQLLDAWQQCSANLYETGFDSLRHVVQQLSAYAGYTSVPLTELFASQLMEPFICTRQRVMAWGGPKDPEGQPYPPGREPWILGMDVDGPRASAIVHPDFFAQGPVRPDQRAKVAWFEHNFVRQAYSWPYGTKTDQNMDYLSTWTGMGNALGGWLSDLSKNKPHKQWRGMSWPFPEVAGADYGRLFENLIRPVVQRLKDAQYGSLHRVFAADVQGGAIDERVLLPAYVRPDPVNGREKYGAFNDKKLQELCRGARVKLLELIEAGHPARELISLEDVQPIDPAFHQQLVAAGATGSRASEPLPALLLQGEQVQGGLPFGGGLQGVPAGGGGGGGGGGALALVLALAAGALVWKGL